MSGCGSCGGNCGSCAGCGASLELTKGELHMLNMLSQIPFLPIARTAADPAPVFLEDDAYSPAEYSLILQCMEKKGLLTLDFDRPLERFDGIAYGSYPIRGSMALTARGQEVLELLELRGIEE